MEDNNDFENSNDTTNNQKSDEPQVSNQNTNERTYWESQSEQVPVSETQNQFYSYYQQQMNEEPSPTQNQPQTTQPQDQPRGYQPNPNVLPPTKKSRGKGVATLIIILLLILSGAATAYAFRDTILNNFAKMTKSPAEYYAYIEKRAIKESVDELKTHLDTTMKQEGTSVAYDVTSDISINRDSINSLMQSSLGMSLEDLEASIGIPIENIGLDFLIAADGSLVNETMGLRLNQVNLITLELFLDAAKQEMFIRLPELSQAYMKQSFAQENSLSDSYTEQLKLLTPDRTADFLTRYSNILVNNIKQVALEEDVTLSLDNLTSECTKLTVTLTEEDFSNIAIAILEVARDDAYIMDLLPMFQVTEEDYLQAIEDSIAELQSPSDTLAGASLQMSVYVDSRGDIIGRELISDDSLEALGYTFLTDKNYNEFEVFIKDTNGNMNLTATGNRTFNDGAYDGSLTVELNDTNSVEPLSNVSFDITFEDVRTERKDNHSYQYGTYTLSSLELMGLQIIMECSVENDIQNNKITLQMGASSLVTINTKTDYLEDYQVVMPPDNSETYDTTQAESYLATFQLEEYISNLSEKLGVDLQSLLDYYLYGGSY
jgi:hypothetical protein